jgi:HK97 family phage portal protein
MGWWDSLRGRRSASVETRSDQTLISLDNPAALQQLFGVLEAQGNLPVVSIAAALQVPAVLAAVAFLSRTLAALPLHSFAAGANGDRLDDDEAKLLNDAPNEEWSSFAWRQYHWQQVFTGGRGMSWIERIGPRVDRIWPMDPELTTVGRRNGRKYYRFDGREYAAADVIDTPFMLRPDQLSAISPIARCNKAISLSIAMADFAGGFFLGGGMPPLALEGPLPSGAEAFKRAAADIKRAVDLAKKSGTPFFPMPPGHALKPVGTDPDKGQMTQARLFQIQEIARVYQLPPVFLQDLSTGTLANTEQQDLHLSKHNIGQWAKAFEDELNLKLFGWRNRRRRVKHNLDGLQRGDFKSRVEALARMIQTGQLMPDEARALEDRPPDPNGKGAKLYIQGATVPLGTVLAAPIGHNGGPPTNDNEEEPANGGNDPA